MIKSECLNAPFLTQHSAITLWLAVVTMIVIPPFSLANFLKGNYVLCLICLTFMSLLVLQCIMIRREKYNIRFTLLALVPSITAYIFFQIFTHGLVGVFWSFPASMVLYFILPLNFAYLSSAFLLAVNVPLIFVRVDDGIALSISITLSLLAAFSGVMLRIIERQQEILSEVTLSKRMHVSEVSSLLRGRLNSLSEKLNHMRQGQGQGQLDKRQLEVLAETALTIDELVNRMYRHSVTDGQSGKN